MKSYEGQWRHFVWCGARSSWWLRQRCNTATELLSDGCNQWYINVGIWNCHVHPAYMLRYVNVLTECAELCEHADSDNVLWFVNILTVGLWSVNMVRVTMCCDLWTCWQCDYVVNCEHADSGDVLWSVNMMTRRKMCWDVNMLTVRMCCNLWTCWQECVEISEHADTDNVLWFVNILTVGMWSVNMMIRRRMCWDMWTC
jgi:hypothetical protein